MSTVNQNWTERTTDDFVYKIGADFVQQIENNLGGSGDNQKALAEKLGVTPGRVSQVLNAPGNLTLKKIVQYARASGMKVAIVAYNDDDPTNEKGAINSQVFEQCWIRYGKPADFFALQDRDERPVRMYVLRPERHLVMNLDITAATANYSSSFVPQKSAANDADRPPVIEPHYVGAANNHG